MFAEDPVSHSNMGEINCKMQCDRRQIPLLCFLNLYVLGVVAVSEADIPVVGNVFSFVITKYPPDWRWQLLKVRERERAQLLMIVCLSLIELKANLIVSYLPGNSIIQVTMWLLAIGCGLVVGKTIIHGMLLSRFLKLKMFRADQVGLNFRQKPFKLSSENADNELLLIATHVEAL